MRLANRCAPRPPERKQLINVAGWGIRRPTNSCRVLSGVEQTKPLLTYPRRRHWASSAYLNDSAQLAEQIPKPAMRSASRRIATICSSLKRLFGIGSSLSKEPFFQKSMDRKTGSGHRSYSVNPLIPPAPVTPHASSRRFIEILWSTHAGRNGTRVRARIWSRNSLQPGTCTGRVARCIP